MTTKATVTKAQKAARRLRRGELVEIRWKDSGSTASRRKQGLSTRKVYGRVYTVNEEEETVILAMDVDEEDEDEAEGNEWGTIWIPAIFEVNKLIREADLE